MGKRIGDQVRSMIVSDVFAFGKAKALVAKDHDVSVASVFTTRQVFEAVKENKWDEVRGVVLSSRIGINAVSWAIHALNATPPAQWFEQLDKELREKNTIDRGLNNQDEPPKEEPKSEPPKPIAPEETPTGAKVFIPAPTAEVGWQTRIKTNPGRVSMTVYFNGVPVVEGLSRIKANTELDLMQAISYAAHMCYKLTEQKKLKGV